MASGIQAFVYTEFKIPQSYLNVLFLTVLFKHFGTAQWTISKVDSFKSCLNGLKVNRGDPVKYKGFITSLAFALQHLN